MSHPSDLKTQDSKLKGTSQKALDASSCQNSLDLKSHVKNFPAKSGVYLMKDINNQVIYVGKAKSLKNRVRSYFSSDKNFKNRFLIPRVEQIDYMLTDTETEAYLLEAQLIKKYKPRYNVRLKDDKSYPYIRCSIKEQFPRFYMERRVKKKDSIYFGPYTEAFFVRRMIRFLNEQFQIRDCSNTFMKSRKKPCLTYHIGNCPAPCVKKNIQKDYSAQVKEALFFLKGKNQKKTLISLTAKMKQLAKKNQFEQAQRLKDRVRAIELCQPHLINVQKEIPNKDIWAFYSKDKHFLFQILHVRQGALTGQSFQYLKKSDKNLLPKDLVLSIVIQYYIDNLIPDLILLPAPFTRGQTHISKIKGSFVKVRAPKSVTEKQWADKAFQNAQSHFTQQNAKQIVLQKKLKRNTK